MVVLWGRNKLNLRENPDYMAFRSIISGASLCVFMYVCVCMYICMYVHFKRQTALHMQLRTDFIDFLRAKRRLVEV
jgi:hypothetical protein